MTRWERLNPVPVVKDRGWHGFFFIMATLLFVLGTIIALGSGPLFFATLEEASYAATIENETTEAPNLTERGTFQFMVCFEKDQAPDEFEVNFTIDVDEAEVTHNDPRISNSSHRCFFQREDSTFSKGPVIVAFDGIDAEFQIYLVTGIALATSGPFGGCCGGCFGFVVLVIVVIRFNHLSSQGSESE